MANDKNVAVSTEEVDHNGIASAYMKPEAVFNELPQVTVEFLTDLARYKYSKEIVAAGASLTDTKLAAFRVQWLIDIVSSAHTQYKKNKDATLEKAQRALYLQFRERGLSVQAASKASGYDPLT